MDVSLFWLQTRELNPFLVGWLNRLPCLRYIPALFRICNYAEIWKGRLSYHLCSRKHGIPQYLLFLRSVHLKPFASRTPSKRHARRLGGRYKHLHVPRNVQSLVILQRCKSVHLPIVGYEPTFPRPLRGVLLKLNQRVFAIGWAAYPSSRQLSLVSGAFPTSIASGVPELHWGRKNE